MQWSSVQCANLCEKASVGEPVPPVNEPSFPLRKVRPFWVLPAHYRLHLLNYRAFLLVATSEIHESHREILMADASDSDFLNRGHCFCSSQAGCRDAVIPIVGIA